MKEVTKSRNFDQKCIELSRLSRVLFMHVLNYWHFVASVINSINGSGALVEWYFQRHFSTTNSLIEWPGIETGPQR